MQKTHKLVQGSLARNSIYPRSLLQNLEDWACGRYSRYSFDLPELITTVVLTTLSHLIQYLVTLTMLSNRIAQTPVLPVYTITDNGFGTGLCLYSICLTCLSH